MSTYLQNSIWPNAGGTLGQIKVQIPTGTDNDTIKWPTGDALVHNFVFNKSKLVGFVDTKALIANSSKTSIFPYDYVNISLPSIAEGEMTYNYDQCTYFVLNGKVLKGDVPTNDALEIITKKYIGCKTVDDIKAVDPNYKTTDIVDGVWKEGLGDLEQGGNGNWNGGMFYDCTALTSFASDLSSLTNGHYMFNYCSNLTTFSADLSSLTNGDRMFNYCSNLTSFNSDLPSLTTALCMFYKCTKLTSFFADLSSLTNGHGMFEYCYKLTTFTSDLSSLTNGSSMFIECKLDTASVQNIADTIKDVNGLIENCLEGIYTTIDISIGNSTPNEQEEAAFNKMADKGWTVYVNGSEFVPSSCSCCCASCASCCATCCASCCASCSTCCASCCATCCASLTTLDETDGEFVAPTPYWAKPVPSDEQNAQYVDSEGNFYNILGAQFIYGDNLETYGMFTSLEDAAANMRLKKIGEEEIETA